MEIKDCFSMGIYLSECEIGESCVIVNLHVSSYWMPVDVPLESPRRHISEHDLKVFLERIN